MRKGTKPLYVALLDLDHFKAYNDRHGHPAGDELLRRAARAWRKAMRANDVLARYGGEEFAVLLAGCEEERAIEIAERLRQATIDEQHVSIGLARWDGCESAERLVARADRRAVRGQASRARPRGAGGVAAGARTPRFESSRPPRGACLRCSDEFPGRARSQQQPTTLRSRHDRSQPRPTAPHRNAAGRPLALDRAGRALRRRADDRPRRHRRERRAALDPGRPRLLAVQPGLGRQRLSHRLRRPAAARRAARRPHLAARRVPRRPGVFTSRRWPAASRRPRRCSSPRASCRASAAR